MLKNKKLFQALRVVLILLAIFTILVILWIDVTTNIWQERVILAALAASMISFLGTYAIAHLFINRVREKRWAPVTGLALTDFMHSLADEDRSEITRGIIVARTLTLAPISHINADNPAATLTKMLQEVHAERDRLTHTLARWSQFLASTGDNEAIMKHVARVSLQLEVLGDKIIRLTGPITSTTAANSFGSAVAASKVNAVGSAAVTDNTIGSIPAEKYLMLERETDKYNSFLAALLVEIQDRLHNYHVSQRS